MLLKAWDVPEWQFWAEISWIWFMYIAAIVVVYKRYRSVLVGKVNKLQE